MVTTDDTDDTDFQNLAEETLRTQWVNAEKPGSVRKFLNPCHP